MTYFTIGELKTFCYKKCNNYPPDITNYTLKITEYLVLQNNYQFQAEYCQQLDRNTDLYVYIPT